MQNIELYFTMEAIIKLEKEANRADVAEIFEPTDLPGLEDAISQFEAQVIPQGNKGRYDDIKINPKWKEKKTLTDDDVRLLNQEVNEQLRNRVKNVRAIISSFDDSAQGAKSASAHLVI